MELDTRTVGDTGSEMVLKDFTIHDVTIPRGFIFDGASAPRFLWSVIPPMYKTKKAACLHDYLCRYAKTPSERKAADRAFWDVLKDTEGINKVRSALGYAGVRVGAFFGIGVRYPNWTDKIK